MKKDNKTIQIHIRIDRDTYAVLKKACMVIGLTMSQFIRYAIHVVAATISVAKTTGNGRQMEKGGDRKATIDMLADTVGLLREMQAGLGKIGGNLNQAVHNMNTSLKSGARGVDPKDEQAVKSCSEQVSECIREIGSGIGSIRQIVKKL